MSAYHDAEVLRAGKLGTFRVNALLTRISSEGDLSPDYPLLGAVSLHAHEFTHYLHNLSTCSGLNSLVSCFLLVTPFAVNADEYGVLTPSPDDKPNADVVYAFQLMKIMRGEVRYVPKDLIWPKVMNWSFRPPTSESFEIREPGTAHASYGVKRIFEIEAAYAGGSIVFELVPGLDFISEGVAYTVEREIRRKAFIKEGISEIYLDSETPSYPYLAFEPLVNYLSGRETTPEERVRIGNLALLAPNPSEALVFLCESVRDDGIDGGSSEFKRCASIILELFAEYSAHIINVQIPALVTMFSTSIVLSKGMQVYEKLIKTALASRLEHPSMEQNFIMHEMTKDSFIKLSSFMLERLVCQEKPGGESEITWVGVEGSVASLPQDKLEAFAVLQSSIHYMQHHFTQDGRFSSSHDLQSAMCPFSGACSIEGSCESDDICKNRPWDAHHMGGPGVICTYEAGKFAVRSEVKTFPV
jgi:hypothetical protein